MMYNILSARCICSDGKTRSINLSNGTTCNELSEFRARLKKRIEEMNMPDGVSIEKMLLTYEQN